MNPFLSLIPCCRQTGKPVPRGWQPLPDVMRRLNLIHGQEERIINRHNVSVISDRTRRRWVDPSAFVEAWAAEEREKTALAGMVKFADAAKELGLCTSGAVYACEQLGIVRVFVTPRKSYITQQDFERLKNRKPQRGPNPLPIPEGYQLLSKSAYNWELQKKIKATDPTLIRRIDYDKYKVYHVADTVAWVESRQKAKEEARQKAQAEKLAKSKPKVVITKVIAPVRLNPNGLPELKNIADADCSNYTPPQKDAIQASIEADKARIRAEIEATSARHEAQLLRAKHPTLADELALWKAEHKAARKRASDPIPFREHTPKEPRQPKPVNQRPQGGWLMKSI